MKSFLFPAAAALLPSVLGCSNPDTNKCAGAFVTSSAEIASFCATFTTSKVTETTDLPSAFAEVCGYKTKKFSSACSCYMTGSATGAAATATATATGASQYTGSAAASQITGAAVKAKSSKTTSSKTTSSKTSKSSDKSSSTESSKTTKTTAATASATATTLSTIVKSESTSASAAAATTTTPTKTSATIVGSGSGGTTCTVTEYAAISSAVASCSNIMLSGISAPASSTIDLQKLQTSATVIFAGNTTFGTTVDSDFDPIVIKGTDITITGADGHVIDGNGPAYWDGEGSNGGTDKPDHFIVVKDCVNAKITNLNIKNWPVHCFDITGNEGLEISGLTLDNSEGDEPNSASGTKAAAHNSDGFDISSSDSVTLSDITVHNQDDCVAVTSGSSITVTGMYCYGGHGLSIGSIGGKSNNTVDGVTFSDSQVVNSENACRIKTNSGKTGTVSNIVYSNITMSNITDYGIDIQQDYLNGGPTGDPTNGVTISNVQFIDVTGTVSGDDAYDYYILCGSDSCSDFTFTDVSITGGNSSCNYPSTGCPS